MFKMGIHGIMGVVLLNIMCVEAHEIVEYYYQKVCKRKGLMGE